jgi:hypothetical protein
MTTHVQHIRKVFPYSVDYAFWQWPVVAETCKHVYSHITLIALDGHYYSFVYYDFPWRSIRLWAGEAPSAGVYGPNDRRIRVRLPAGQKFFSGLLTFWTLSKAHKSVIPRITHHCQNRLEFTETFLFTIVFGPAEAHPAFDRLHLLPRLRMHGATTQLQHMS